MDPNSNLREQLEICKRIQKRVSEHADVADVDRLAELVVALDWWICMGGFIPHVWNRKGV